MDFGTYLRSLREAKGLSIRQVAAELCIEHSYLSKLERGENTKPSVKLLEGLAGVLEVSPDIMAAMAGQISIGLLDAIQRHPEEFAALFEKLKVASKQTLIRTTRAVRDGDW